MIKESIVKLVKFRHALLSKVVSCLLILAFSLSNTAYGCDGISGLRAVRYVEMNRPPGVKLYPSEMLPEWGVSEVRDVHDETFRQKLQPAFERARRLLEEKEAEARGIIRDEREGRGNVKELLKLLFALRGEKILLLPGELRAFLKKKERRAIDGKRRVIKQSLYEELDARFAERLKLARENSLGKPGVLSREEIVVNVRGDKLKKAKDAAYQALESENLGALMKAIDDITDVPPGHKALPDELKEECREAMLTALYYISKKAETKFKDNETILQKI